MVWTLWRGDDLLGTLHERSALHAARTDPRHVNAVLVPDPAHVPPELATFPPGAFVGGRLWLVVFTQDPDAPAT